MSEAAPDELARLRDAKRLKLVDLEGDRTDDPRAWLEERLGVPVRAVRKLGRQDARWQLVLLVEGEEIVVHLGRSADVLRRERLEAALFDATGQLPAFERGEAKKAAAVLGLLAEVTDSTLTRAEETREWLAGAVRGLGACDPTDSAELYETLTPSPVGFVGRDGRCYLRLGDLVRHLLAHHGQRVSTADLATRLGELGFERDQLAARPPGGGKERKARYWVSPPDFDPTT